MKPVAVLALVALTAVAASSFGAWFVASTVTPAEASGTSGAAAPAAENELVARLSAQDEELTALRARIAMLEARADATPRQPVGEGLATREELAALREELLDATTPDGAIPSNLPLLAGGQPTPEFTEQVGRALDEIHERDARDGAARKSQSRGDRLRERLPDLREKLSLTPGQERDLESALLAHYERQAQYAVMWETGEISAKEDFGPILENDNLMFADELAGFLTVQQLEDYEALQGDLYPGTTGWGGGKD